MRFSLLQAMALAFAAGILVADQCGWGMGSALQWGLALLAIGFAWQRARFVLAVGVAFSAGAVSLAVPVEASRRARPHATFDAVVEARVCRASAGPGWVSRDLCAARNRRVRGFDRRAVPTGIRIVASQERESFATLEDWSVGSWVRARIRIRPLVSAHNPGSRSRIESLVRRGIGARASLVSPPLAVSWRSATLAPGWGIGVSSLRSRLGDRLNGRGLGGGLIAALTLGDRRGLSEAVWDAFRSLGTAHLLAISGFHLVGIAGLAYWISLACVRQFSAFTARFDTRRFAAAAALGAATLYAAVGGFGVSVQRAWVCLGVVLAVSVLGRRAPLREGFAGAALVVLSLEPAALFDLGAELSFAATAALLFDSGGLGRKPAPGGDEREGRVQVGRYLVASLRASATALAATTPILAAHGVAVTPVALLANLVLVPIFGFVVLPASLLGLCLAGFEGGAQALDALCAVFREGVEFLQRLGKGAAGLSIAEVDSGLTWGTSAGIAAVTLFFRSTAKRVAGALACVAVLAVPFREPVAGPAPYLAVFDVGRGDSILIRGTQVAILVDGGGAFRSGRDQGTSVVVPALRSLGVEKLDVVIASHADLDHRGGLPAIVRELAVGEIWVPVGESSENFSELRHAARQRKVPVIERGQGDTDFVRGDLRLSTLWPSRSLQRIPRNERSLVTRVEVADVAVLLPGDVGFETEATLLEQKIRLEADVLLLPHHGSAGSLSAAFLEAVSPGVAVVSAPCQETSRLPAKVTLERVDWSGVPVWWTGRDGAVVVLLKRPIAAWGWRGGAVGRSCQWSGAGRGLSSKRPREVGYVDPP